MKPGVLIVSATRHDAPTFEQQTFLGSSLKRLSFDKNIQASVTVENQHGLPAIYNAQIVEANKEKILVFTHDDVYIDDFFLSARLEQALGQFDLVGLAGNKRRAPFQPAWGFVSDNPQWQWDRPEFLSGAVCHVAQGNSVVSDYGPAPAACQLLDGVFLAAKVEVLLSHNVRFDERFRFHFYDLDFCRTAAEAGLKLGTWPIAITHASGGVFGSPEWVKYRQVYFQKWGD